MVYKIIQSDSKKTLASGNKPCQIKTIESERGNTPTARDKGHTPMLFDIIGIYLGKTLGRQ